MSIFPIFLKVRFYMKMHAFVREVAPRVLAGQGQKGISVYFSVIAFLLSMEYDCDTLVCASFLPGISRMKDCIPAICMVYAAF